MNFCYNPPSKDNTIEFKTRTQHDILTDELNLMKTQYLKANIESSERISLPSFLIGCGWVDISSKIEIDSLLTQVFFLPNYLFCKEGVNYIIEIDHGNNIRLHDENVGDFKNGWCKVLMNKEEFYGKSM